MRLLSRSSETPSLETWLGRDVPHEREMASETLTRLGREKALAALLILYNREETKRNKREYFTYVFGTVFLWSLVVFLVLSPLLHLISTALWLWGFALFSVSILVWGAGLCEQGSLSQLQKNLVIALFDYTDSPLSADVLCRGLHNFRFEERYAVYDSLQRVLPLLPDDKEALTKEAREKLRSCLWINNLPSEVERSRRMVEEMSLEKRAERIADHARYIDFQMAVLRYLVRVQDTDAIPNLREMEKAFPFIDGDEQVIEAARTALQAFGEPLLYLDNLMAYSNQTPTRK